VLMRRRPICGTDDKARADPWQGNTGKMGAM